MPLFAVLVVLEELDFWPGLEAGAHSGNVNMETAANQENMDTLKARTSERITTDLSATRHHSIVHMLSS